MRQATLIAPDSWIVGFLVAGFLGSWFLALLQQLPELLAHFYFPSRATIAATFILLTRCFCHFCCFSFFLFFIFFWGIFAISAGRKQKEEAVESVAWRHNELKFIGSFGKIREIYYCERLLRFMRAMDIPYFPPAI